MAPRRYGMVIDDDACLRCEACVVACKAENEVPTGKSRNWVQEVERGRYPVVAVQMEPGQCMQCDNPPCVRVCPTGASYVDPDGVVLVRAGDCIGCRYCMQACPYGARYFDEESGTVDKCTFCRHRLDEGREPACVTTCPTKARLFGDLADAASPIAEVLARGRLEVRKEQAGTAPRVFYRA
jgi:Fe-S-cluster-containing dehydrogenase component